MGEAFAAKVPKRRRQKTDAPVLPDLVPPPAKDPFKPQLPVGQQVKQLSQALEEYMGADTGSALFTQWLAENKPDVFLYFNNLQETWHLSGMADKSSFWTWLNNAYPSSAMF